MFEERALPTLPIPDLPQCSPNMVGSTRYRTKYNYTFTTFTQVHGAVIALYFEKSGHFPMVVESEIQIQ